MIPWILFFALLWFFLFGPETKGMEGPTDNKIWMLILFPFWILWKVLVFFLHVVAGVMVLDAVKRHKKREWK
jgi:hypothetical protein